MSLTKQEERDEWEESKREREGVERVQETAGGLNHRRKIRKMGWERCSLDGFDSLHKRFGR